MAVICGAESWTEVALFGQTKRKWLATFLELPGGIPSHDTFNCVFALLDPDAFERCFLAWMSALVELTGKITTERHYYISTLKGCDDTAAKATAGHIRSHRSGAN